LSDLYNPAIELAELTATYSENNCKDLVSAYLMKDLSLMPSHEMFDLVVANPPHVKTNVSILANTNRICTDLEWRAHKNFFQHIKSHLQPDAIVLLQENKDGSTVKDFEDMVKHAGLKITDCFNSAIDPFYYIEIQS
jgi:methylase of polypeptide subunit release factors